MRNGFVLIFCSILVCGCTHLHQHYDYQAGNIDLMGGDLQVLVSPRGRSQTNGPPKTTKLASPYCIHLTWRGSNIALDRPIDIHIDLITAENGLSMIPGQIGSGRVQPMNQYFQLEDWSTFFHSGKCDLVIEGHETLKIKGRLVIDKRSEDFEISLAPKYWQEWRNDTIDAINSV